MTRQSCLAEISRRQDEVLQFTLTWCTVLKRSSKTQGSHFFYPVKFPDFSLTFPWFPKNFPWFNSLKKHFPQIFGFKRFENGLEKSSLIWNFFPWFWLKTSCFSLISLTGKSLQNFPWIPWFPWSVGTPENMSFALLDHHHKKVTEYVSNYDCITDLQAKYITCARHHIEGYPDILRNPEQCWI